MSKKEWIVVANSAMARVLERDAPGWELTEIASFAHPNSRLHAHDLTDSGPGQSCGARADVAPRNDAHDKEQTQFAREVARHLRVGACAHRYDSLEVFASNPFLGKLMGQLDNTVKRQVNASHPLDLTALPPTELRTRLRDALRL